MFGVPLNNKSTANGNVDPNPMDIFDNDGNFSDTDGKGANGSGGNGSGTAMAVEELRKTVVWKYLEQLLEIMELMKTFWPYASVRVSIEILKSYGENSFFTSVLI